MIVCKNLYFRYETSKQVLKNLNLRIPKGSVCSIMGASGSGKSTLLKIMAGIYEPQNGTVNTMGTPAAEALQNGQFGFVFQDYKLLPFLSVKSNIAWPVLNSPYLKSKSALLDTGLSTIIDKIGLSKFTNTLPHELSGGMKARVAIARALLSRPQILYIDEAFSALDVGWRSTLYDLVLSECKSSETGLIFVSHDIDDAIENSDICIVLSENGEISSIIEIADLKYIEAKTRIVDAIMGVSNNEN